MNITADILVSLIMAACTQAGLQSSRCLIQGVKVTNCAVKTEGNIDKKDANECINKYILHK